MQCFIIVHLSYCIWSQLPWGGVPDYGLKIFLHYSYETIVRLPGGTEYSSFQHQASWSFLQPREPFLWWLVPALTRFQAPQEPPDLHHEFKKMCTRLVKPLCLGVLQCNITYFFQIKWIGYNEQMFQTMVGSRLIPCIGQITITFRSVYL